MRALIIGFFTATVSLCALQLRYPWATYYGNFHFGWWRTMSSYLIVAGLLGATASAVAAVCLSRVRSPGLVAVACGFCTLAFVFLFGFLFGPVGIDIPGARVRGIFFPSGNFCISILTSACQYRSSQPWHVCGSHGEGASTKECGRRRGLFGGSAASAASRIR